MFGEQAENSAMGQETLLVGKHVEAVTQASSQTGTLALRLKRKAVRLAIRMSSGFSYAAMLMLLLLVVPIGISRHAEPPASTPDVGDIKHISPLPVDQPQTIVQRNAADRPVIPDIAMIKVRKASELERAAPAEGPKTSGPLTIAPSIPAQQPAPVQPPPSPDQLSQSATPPLSWTDSEVALAMKSCVALLSPIMADVEPRAPLKEMSCGTPAPVSLKRLGPEHVLVEPAAIVNCAVVAALHNWLEKVAQPAARELFGSPIARMTGVGGYACRNRNGVAFGPISEHAFANAVDISGFILADGRAIEVMRDWGRAAQAQHLANTEAKQAANAAGPKALAHSAATSKSDAQPLSALNTPQRLGVISAKPSVANGAPSPSTVKPPTETVFLRRLHAGACGVFGTVLGPEANQEHATHLHFDMKARTRTSYCQ